MEPPAITPRRRRPFLAPVWLILLICLAVLGIALALWRSASNTMVIVVPAAEGTLGSIDDPPLSAAGSQQAQRLAQRFSAAPGKAGVTAIFIAPTRRAQQTASPLAQMLGLRPVVLSSSNAEAMAGQILRGHRGDTLLVVCGPAEIATLVQTLARVAIAPPEPRSLYILSIPSDGPDKVLRMTN